MTAPTLHGVEFDTLRSRYRSREVTPTQVTQSALAHALQINDTLNAFALIDQAGAITAAEQSTKRWRAHNPLSPIDGVPITVKEFAAVQGWPTRRGSTLTDTAPASSNSPFVARLRAAGAILLGKTRAPEFNWKGVTDSPGYGITRNPWNPRLTPGGSSGGCAAAVAAGVVRVSIGSDAAGSVRIPAAFTGILGLKPSLGRIPIVPFPSQFFHLAHFGPLGATSREIIDVMTAISGPDSRDWTSLTGNTKPITPEKIKILGLRIGVLDSQYLDSMDNIVLRGLNEFVSVLEDGGLDCQPVQLDIKSACAASAHLYRLGCAFSIKHYSLNQHHQLDPGLLDYLHYADSACLQRELSVAQTRDAFGGALAALFEHIDVLVLPTVPVLPFAAGLNTPPNWHDKDWLSWNPYTPAFNLVGNPVLNYPIWPSAADKPTGIQLVGPQLEEGRLLALASWLEEKIPVRLVSS